MSPRDASLKARSKAHPKVARTSSPKLLSAFALACSAACSAGSAPTRVLPPPVAGAPAPVDEGVVVTMPICAADNPFCQQPPLVTPTTTGTAPQAPTPTPGTDAPAPVPTPMNCGAGAVPVDLRPAGVNIMIAVDGAASMAAHWSDLATAIRSLRENNPTASFGAHLFWSDALDPTMAMDIEGSANKSNNACLKSHARRLELGNHTAAQLVSFFGNAPPGGTIFDVYQVSSVIEPLYEYVTTANTLTDPARTNYLIVFTGGNDNCFGSAFVSGADKLMAYQKLATELEKRNIRLIPVGLDPPGGDPNSLTSLFGAQQNGLTGTSFLGEPLPTNYTVLEKLLEYGGSGLKEVPRIDTPAKLRELVARVGQTVNNCRFDLPSTLDSSTSVNPFELTFSINSKVVPRDRRQQNGWDFVDGSTKSVEFFGQGCEAVQAGQELQANKSCEQDVCGTAAVSVATKPRAVLLLLDSSASRIECSDGSLNCLSLPGTEGRPLSFWETVQQAVSTALIAPVNNDVAFGMQFFPGKNAESLSCDVATQPEIPPGSGAQIAIMKAMLEKLPLGLSPVLGVLENVAATPGMLADPSVIGAVVLLSDGGDNCSGLAQRQIVTRMGAAAKKLADLGVRTYAIRYGSRAGETPEQSEQLTAVATQGGTATTAGKVAYLDAKNADELSAALAAISDRLATCAFKLNDVPANVDKNRTNLFLNGETVGFDATAAKREGWNWVDAERTTVELYGAACTSFKTSRRTQVVVEFGCEPVVAPPPPPTPPPPPPPQGPQ